MPEPTDHRAQAERWPHPKADGLRCQWTDSPLGQLQQCQLKLGHDGDHDYGNAAVRR